ncbi:PRSS1_2_3 [Lepeophtheirus salmonis]|uniref:PRSS1_2_3 n=1 Tax=Lepeophtheirus salmonis TaxID=72036 RepID=A0A7R8CZU5_LEPSM|nr:PRSS1_2_3 [Lepeophtheirus salmonis]CAF2977606.1 PRSS1_2_3 [Lepeophtheirus salmonis]
MIKKLSVYKNSSISTDHHTVTMLRFSSLHFNEKVKPIALPEKEQEFIGDVVVSGWGTISSSGPPSPVLKAVTVQVVSDEDCSDAYYGSIDETMICAAAPGKDSCQGDSGGPLAQDGTLSSLHFNEKVKPIALPEKDQEFIGDSSLHFNEKVKPIALPEKDQEFIGDVVVSGWGTISSSGPPSPVLKAVTVQVVSDEDCSDAYYGSIDETMICAAAPGKDSCQGDSGGPLAQDGTLSSLHFNEKVKPIALPEKDQEFIGDVVVSGWGTISSSGPPSPVLKAVTVQVVSDEDCSDAYYGSIDESMICAAAPGKDSCQGDSGGPLAQDGTLSSLHFNEKVKPIALPEKDQEFIVLKAVTVQVVSDEDCSDAYYGSIDETMICAAAPGKDSCQGDSGGPLAQDGTLVANDMILTSTDRKKSDDSPPGVTLPHPETLTFPLNFLFFLGRFTASTLLM